MAFINSVFLSATFHDLEKERRAAIEAFARTGILPFSMEFFPADYRDKQDFIEKLIYEADFFALIIGGKYGAYLSDDNKISFTEWEYGTAVKYGKKIFAFVPSNLGKIPGDKTDKDDEKHKKLVEFIKKVRAIPLTRQYEYDDIGGLEKEFLISFQPYGYAGKSLSKYCGVWVSTINKVVHEKRTFPRKSDEWTFYGRDNHVYGTVRRLKPKENDRIWSFVGLDFGNQLVISFAEDDQVKMSAGIMIVRRDYETDGKMSGYYYEFSKVDSNGHPIPIPIILNRKKI
jgi:hypothetical protein